MKLTKQRIRGPHDRRLRKRSTIPANERPPVRAAIERDLDGYVHTPNGFISKGAYISLWRENPDAGLPAWDELPYSKPIDY